MAGNGYNHVGHQQLAVGVAPEALTFPVRSDNGEAINPSQAVIYVGNEPIRWRADGVDPTASVGIFVSAGGYIEWDDPERNYLGFLKRVRFVKDSTAGAGNAVLDVAYIQ